MISYSICFLPGDGIGPEVTRSVQSVLEQVAETFQCNVDVVSHEIGGASIDAYGSPLTEPALEACKAADAVFLGAVGGPAWDHLTGDKRPESGLLRLRKELGVFANLRPVKIYSELASYSPLKAELLQNVDIVVVRELTGGLYFGQPKGQSISENGKRFAVDTMVYDEDEIRRIAKVAFELAKTRNNHVFSVDKANVLSSSRLWRDVVTELASDYPEITLEHMLVDNCAMQLVRNPSQFDVILTENMFGDILSDEAAMLTGSIGMLPSASIGNSGGLFEPVHGSAPDIAGKNCANPLASIASLALLFRYSLQRLDIAEAIEDSISEFLKSGNKTFDLTDNPSEALKTTEVTEKIVSYLKQFRTIDA